METIEHIPSNIAETSNHHVSLAAVTDNLADSKAEDIITIDLVGRSALGDAMIIATGRSQRHVNAICDHLLRFLKDHGVRDVKVEGLMSGDWVLLDTGDFIIHLFRPEIREFYNLEKIWCDLS